MHKNKVFMKTLNKKIAHQHTNQAPSDTNWRAVRAKPKEPDLSSLLLLFSSRMSCVVFPHGWEAHMFRLLWCSSWLADTAVSHRWGPDGHTRPASIVTAPRSVRFFLIMDKENNDKGRLLAASKHSVLTDFHWRGIRSELAQGCVNCHASVGLLWVMGENVRALNSYRNSQTIHTILAFNAFMGSRNGLQSTLYASEFLLESLTAPKYYYIIIIGTIVVNLFSSIFCLVIVIL